MNLINKKGMEVLEYKKEFLKKHSDLVKKALENNFRSLLDANIIESLIYEATLNKNTSYQELQKMIEDMPDYMKTEEDLFQEYEKIRKEIDLLLKEKDLGFLKTESVVSTESILITQTFSLGRDFIQSYFMPEDELALEKMMEEKGFARQFFVFRLMAIFKPFIREVSVPHTIRSCKASLVYHEKKTNKHCIDLFFEIPIDVAEKIKDNEKERNIIFESIKSVTKKSQKTFDERIVI